MGLFEIFGGLIMGAFIWFFLGYMLEDFFMNRLKIKKYGFDSNQKLTKQDKQGFYFILAVISSLLGILIAYLGSKGLLPNT